jgi:CBS domain-containing protein
MARVETAAVPVLVLDAHTAAEIMTSNPVSIRATATVHQAIALLTDKGFSAAPVIDEAGHPIGVLSRSDILAYDRERAAQASDAHALAGEAGGPLPAESTDTPGSTAAALVRDLMTPAVFSVAPDTPAHQVVQELLGLNVHRLFVVDRDGVLVGVISALDVLRHLRPR